MFKTGRNSQLICSRISEDLSRATDWATVWGMQFNAEKSEHLIISTKQNNTSKQRVLMDNTQIPQVPSQKHLGIHFSDTLSWQKHIDTVYTSSAQRVGMIRHLRWRFPPAVLKKIFIGAVQPKPEYACAVWSGGSTQKLQKLCTSFFLTKWNGLTALTKKIWLSYFTCSHVLQDSLTKCTTLPNNASPGFFLARLVFSWRVSWMESVVDINFGLDILLKVAAWSINGSRMFWLNQKGFYPDQHHFWRRCSR